MKKAPFKPDSTELEVAYNRRKHQGMTVLHVHSQYEMLFITEGTYKIFLGDLIVAEGNTPCLMIVKNYIYHGSQTDPNIDYEYYAAYYNPFLLNKIPVTLCDYRSTLDCDFFMMKPSPKLFDRLMFYMKRLLDGDNERIKISLLTIIFNEINSASDNDNTHIIKKLPNNYIFDVLNYINEHVLEKISVTEVAKIFHISTSKLSNDFKSLVKVPLYKYILNLKMEKSKEILKETLSVTDTAAKCGFYNDAHFITAFKLKYNLTPGQYVINID